MNVSTALFKLHRAIILVFAAIVVVVEVVAVAIVTSFVDLQFSVWLAVAGSAAKYWTLVVGIMLVSAHLRLFVTHGVTRRGFAAGAAVFVAVLAAGFAVVVVLGHALESIVVTATGVHGSGYPAAAAAGLLAEYGRVLAVTLAWAVSGALIALGFYRFGAWRGLLVLVPAALPAAVSEGLVAVNERGLVPDRLPYLLAVLLSLAVTVAAMAAFGLLSRNVAIRRPAG